MKKERKCGEDALGVKRKGNGESEVRKRRRRSGGVLQIIYEKKLWFPGFKQCGKGFEEIYCYTHTNTQTFYFKSFVKNCTGILLNLNYPSSLLPLPQFRLYLVLQIIFLPQHRQYSSYLPLSLIFLLFLLLSTVVSSSFSSLSLLPTS